MTRPEPAVAIWVPPATAAAPPPVDCPLGRAALELARRGQSAVFCSGRGPVRFGAGLPPELWARAPRQDGWSPPRFVPVRAVYCRVSRLAQLRSLAPTLQRLGRAGVGVSNPLALVALCRDKLRWAEVAARHRLPFAPAVGEPEAMLPALRAWGSAYLKPRHGSCGRNVARIELSVGQARIDEGEGPRRTSIRALEDWLAERQRREPQLLQRAVALPRGRWRALCLRSLVQRDVSGRWQSAGVVARSSTEHIAGNVARGAEVMTLAALCERLEGADERTVRKCLQALDARVCAAIDAELGDAAALAVEVGIDYLPDTARQLWGIEVNDTPRGKLAVAAATEGQAMRRAHEAAQRRPLEYLAAHAEALGRTAASLRRAGGAAAP